MPKPNTMDDWIDGALIHSAKHVGLWTEDMSKDLKGGKITKLYLDIASLKALITAKLQEAPQPTDNLCFDCGNKLFLWDGKYRCIYDGKTQELASLKGGDV